MKNYVQALHHIGIPTTSMDETIKFYKAFGAEIIHEKTDEDDGHPIRVTLMDLAGVIIECYERTQTPKCVGAVDHIAFRVDDVVDMYRICKEQGYRLMTDCAKELGISSYWPDPTKWFIVYGPNDEKIEFCQE